MFHTWYFGESIGRSQWSHVSRNGDSWELELYHETLELAKLCSYTPENQHFESKNEGLVEMNFLFIHVIFRLPAVNFPGSNILPNQPPEAVPLDGTDAQFLSFTRMMMTPPWTCGSLVCHVALWHCGWILNVMEGFDLWCHVSSGSWWNIWWSASFPHWGIIPNILPIQKDIEQWCQKSKVQHINNVILYGIAPKFGCQRDRPLAFSSWFPPILIGGSFANHSKLEKHGLWTGVRCSDCGWSHYAASKGKHAFVQVESSGISS